MTVVPYVQNLIEPIKRVLEQVGVGNNGVKYRNEILLLALILKYFFSGNEYYFVSSFLWIIMHTFE